MYLHPENEREGSQSAPIFFSHISHMSRYLFSVDKLRNGLVNLHVGVNTEDDDDENHPVKPKAIWAGEGD